MSTERRQNPRVEIVKHVAGRVVPVNAFVQVKEMSVGGMSIETDAELSPNGVHDFRLKLMEGGETLVRGHIVHGRFDVEVRRREVRARRPLLVRAGGVGRGDQALHRGGPSRPVPRGVDGRRDCARVPSRESGSAGTAKRAACEGRPASCTSGRAVGQFCGVIAARGGGDVRERGRDRVGAGRPHLAAGVPIHRALDHGLHGVVPEALDEAPNRLPPRSGNVGRDVDVEPAARRHGEPRETFGAVSRGAASP